MVWETRGEGPRNHRRWRTRTVAALGVVAAGCVAALLVGVGGSAVGASSRSEAASVPSGVAQRELPAPSPEMMAEIRRQVAERRARRDSEAGRMARIRSRRAHMRVSRDGAVAVAREARRDVVGAPPWSPFRLRRGERLLGYTGSDEAKVQLADGTKARVESTVPLRARNAAGELAPVDLGLEDHGSFFSPGNPLTAVRVGKRLGDGISVGDAGARVVPAGAGDVQASLVSGTPFWANVDTDVDMLVKPLPAGVETFWQLRSQDSPEALRLKLELPPGTQLHQATSKQDMGAVEVVRDGQVVAKIAAPGTRDAQGEPVPTSMRVDGDSVVVSVDHRKGDFAYPLLVDPTYTVVDPNWSASNSSDFDGWSWHASNIITGYRAMSDCPGLLKCSTYFNGFPNYPADPNRCVGNAACNGPWGRGLYTLSTNAYMPAAEAAHWVFVAGNAGPEVNIARAEFKDAWGGYGCAPAGCAIAHMQGLLNYTNWVSSWVTTTGYSYSQKTYCTPSTCDAPTNGQNAIAAVQQIHTPSGGYFPNNLDYLMSASVLMTDNTGPNSLTVSHSNQPSGWVQDANETVTASAADGGVGVKEFDVVAHKPDGTTQTLASAVNPCPGNRHGWCPANWSADLPYNTQGLPEGDNTLTITAKDAWGNQTESTAWHVKIDRTPPTIALSGPLKDKEGQTLTDGIWDLTADSSDPGYDQTGSGVKSIDVSVNGQPLTQDGDPDAGHADQQDGCDTADCSLTFGTGFDTREYGVGQRTITARATDMAGNATTSAPLTVGSSTDDPPDTGPAPTQAPSQSQTPSSTIPPFTVYNAGSAIQGLLVTSVTHMSSPPDPANPDQGRQDDVVYIYGNCPPVLPGSAAATVEGGCSPPVQVQSTPLCEAHATLYRTFGDTLESDIPYPHEDLTINGVPAASFNGGTILEIYTGHTTISIKGGVSSLVRLVADNLRVALPVDIPLAHQTLATLVDGTSLPPVLHVLVPPDPAELSSTSRCS